MKITPLDIRQRRFEKSFHGYSPKEILEFLEVVADEFEELHKESIRLREEAKDFQAQLEHHRNREKVLQETMIAAQKMSQELKAAAKKEAEIVVANAEHQAEKIVQSAHQKLVQVMEDINELKRQRVQFESQLRGLLDGHAKLLETFRQSTFADADWERIEDNVTFLAPPKKLNEAS
jgi:cell division initiation protein